MDRYWRYDCDGNPDVFSGTAHDAVAFPGSGGTGTRNEGASDRSFCGTDVCGFYCGVRCTARGRGYDDPKHFEFYQSLVCAYPAFLDTGKAVWTDRRMDRHVSGADLPGNPYADPASEKIVTGGTKTLCKLQTVERKENGSI